MTTLFVDDQKTQNLEEREIGITNYPVRHQDFGKFGDMVNRGTDRQSRASLFLAVPIQRIITLFQKKVQRAVIMSETRKLNTFFDEENTIESLAKAQGVTPIKDMKQLIANFWPDNENVEEFVSQVAQWRHEDERGISGSPA